MEIIKFEGCNVTYAKDQPEYLPLPAYRNISGDVTSCWKMNFKERLKALFTGKVYFTLLTFNNPIQPQIASIDKPVKDIELIGSEPIESEGING
jgi:hypothetical protein